MVSRHDSTFARTAAGSHAVQFGQDVVLTPLGTTTPIPLEHVICGDERRVWKRETTGLELFLTRECWMISDPDNEKYCGVASMENGSTIEVNGQTYIVETATKGTRVIDFNLVRTENSTIASGNLYNRQ